MTATTPGITLDVAGLLTVDVQLGRDAPGRPAQPGKPSVGPPVLDDSTGDVQQPLPVPQPTPQPTAEHHTAPAASASPSSRETTTPASPPPPPAVGHQWIDDPAPSGPALVPTASVTVARPATPVDDDGDRALAALLALVLLIVMILVLVHVWYQRRAELRRDLTEEQWLAMWGGSTGPPRRRAARRGGGRLAVLSPEVVETAERRRLMEAHLRDQLATEKEDARNEGYAQGYADGVTRRESADGDQEPN